MSRNREGPSGRRRMPRSAVAACVAVLALAAGAYVLHIQPGFVDTRRRAAVCRRSLGLWGTAFLRWSRSGAGPSYPDDRADLLASGCLRGARPACPDNGAFAYQEGLAPGMPLGAFLLWEEGAPHRWQAAGGGEYLVFHALTADLQVTAVAQALGRGDPARAEKTLRARLAAHLEAQRRGLAWVRRLGDEPDGTPPGLAAALAGRQGPLVAAFAAYAVGVSGRSDLAGGLLPLLGSGRPEEPALSAACALARLGRREGAGVLVEGLGHERYPVRRRCHRLLRRLSPRDRGYRPFLEAGARREAAEGWRRWWEKERPS